MGAVKEASYELLAFCAASVKKCIAHGVNVATVRLFQDTTVGSTPEMHDAAPSAKRPRTGDTSLDVHSLQATAPAEQQTSDAAGPSQQSAAQDMFGKLRVLSVQLLILKLDLQFACCRSWHARPNWSQDRLSACRD